MAQQELTFKISANAAQAQAEFKKLAVDAANSQKAIATGAKGASKETNELAVAFQTLRSSVATIDGPLGSVAGRIGSLGTLVTTTASSVGAAIGPLAAFAAGLVGASIAAGLLVKASFDLAKSTAEWKGALFDTSQQLGISTETLSALEILAKTTGSSLDGITASLGIFQKKLEEAQDPTSKEAQLLKELGVNADNTEEALRQTLTALAKMPEGFHQTATALEIFGRGGKSMLAILKEMDGDLNGAIAKFRELGLVVSQEDAKAADEFNDQLALIDFQMRALTAQIAQEAIPLILDALRKFSDMMKENKETVELLGTGVTFFAHVFRGAVISIDTTLRKYQPFLVLVAQTYERIANAMGSVSVGAEASLGVTSAGTGEFGGGLDATEATRVHQAARAKEPKAKKAGKSDAQREFEQELKARIDLQQTLNAELRKQLAIEGGLDVTTRAYAVSQQFLTGELEKASKAFQEERIAQAAHIDTLTKRNKTTAEYKQFLKDQAEAVREVIHGTKGHIEIGEDLIDHLRTEGVFLTETEKHWLRMRQAILANADARQALLEVMERQAAVEVAGVAGAGLSDDEVGLAAGRAANELLGAPPPVDPWIEAFAQLKFAGEDAFGALADGMGSLVHNWVLMGTVGPQAMRKMVASVLAGVAAQAAVMAIMELAYGIAALTPWGAAIYGPAPFHFKSAAMFGAVAVAAGVGGRLAAGSAFQSATGGAGGGGGSSQTPGATKPPPVDVNRRNFNDRPVEIRLSFADGMDDVLEAKIINKWNSNSRLRTVIKNDGG